VLPSCGTVWKFAITFGPTEVDLALKRIFATHLPVAEWCPQRDRRQHFLSSVLHAKKCALLAVHAESGAEKLATPYPIDSTGVVAIFSD
jgi:hypothetical protein